MDTKKFFLSLPERIKPDMLDELETIVQFDISGTGGGQYTLKIEDGECMVEEGLLGVAKCKVVTSDNNFGALINQSLSPLMAVMTGKVKVSNKAELLRCAGVLGLM